MKNPWKDAWTLMRIPFSVFLMPVFWMSLAALPASQIRFLPCLAVFSILHFLIYPASNGYNSLIDKDEGPIGGIEKPPKPNLQLQILVLIFDVLGLAWSFLHDVYFGFCVAVYWLMSKAYSHPAIRLKKFSWLSWLVVAVFQGGWTVLMVWTGAMQTGKNGEAWPDPNWLAVASLFMAGSYPLTQIYQHSEDSKRGDNTLSILLGIRGTFLFSGIFIALGSALMFLQIWQQSESPAGIALMALSAMPSLYFFNRWALKCIKDPAEANYRNTMQFNRVSSLGLSLGFFLLLCLKIWGNSLPLQP